MRSTVLFGLGLSVLIAVGFLLPARARVKRQDATQQLGHRNLGFVTYRRAPYELSNVFLNGYYLPTQAHPQPPDGFKFSGPLSTDPEEWLKGMRFTLTNNYSSAITHINISINFTETRQTGPMLVYQILLGQPPDLKDAPVEPISIAPSGKLDYLLPDSKLPGIRSFLKTRGYTLANLEKAQLEIVHIVYADGVHWSSGDFHRPDPDNPRRSVKISN